MRALEVFGFKHYLSGPSDHPVDAPDGTSESMLSSGISRNIFIWVLVRVAMVTVTGHVTQLQVEARCLAILGPGPGSHRFSPNGEPGRLAARADAALTESDSAGR
jgi:hypothetical protein